jgi:hypothetical protein
MKILESLMDLTGEVLLSMGVLPRQIGKASFKISIVIFENALTFC